MTSKVRTGRAAGEAAANSSAYRTQSADTTVEAERLLFERLRELPAWRKAEMLSAANRAVRDLGLAGLLFRYPSAAEDELRRRLAVLYLGRDLAVRWLGWDPDREGY